MARTVQDHWQYAMRLEQELQKLLGDEKPPHRLIEEIIDQLRIACEAVIFLDFDFATTKNIETRLWDSHSSINNRYRKIINSFKSPPLQNHLVEKRKWDKRYADFLKKSQYFYKGYIQRLASHFPGVPELSKIANRLELDTLSADEAVSASGETAKSILRSCYTTLLRLGDLSRYRNTIKTHDKSYDKALAYYGLANDLDPESGNAFNQMAVIALAEGEHLNAVYYLYRALAIKEPYPMARNNLSVQFKKIENEWEAKGQDLVANISLLSDRSAQATTPLITWFVRLHAKLYQGVDFVSHDELENEVLSQLTVLLKEQSLEGILEKFVLINIAAEYFAGERLKEDTSEKHVQSYYFFLRLNIRTLFMLLQILQTELAGSYERDDAPDVTGQDRQATTETITAVTRRILAALRQYSTWLVSCAVVITGMTDNAILAIHIKELWSSYTSTMSLLVSAFPKEVLTSVEYLLEEDADTVGFAPLRDSLYTDPYTDGNGLKPRFTDRGIDRQHPNLEMLSRIRDLLTDAMILSTRLDANGVKIAPVSMTRGEFHFLEDGLPLSPDISGNFAAQYDEDINFETPNSPNIIRLHNDLIARPSSVAPSDSLQSISMRTDLDRMVNDLLAPTTSPNGRQQQLDVSIDPSYGMHSSTFAEMFQSNAIEVGAQLTGRPTGRPFPSLPGLQNPFHPQPGELLDNSANRPRTATRLSPSHPLHTRGSAENISLSDISRSGWTDTNSYSNQRLARGHPLQPTQNSTNTPTENLRSTGHSLPSSVWASTPKQGHGIPSFSTNFGLRGVDDFEKVAMLQSSLYDGNEPARFARAVKTPPGGQGG